MSPPQPYDRAPSPEFLKHLRTTGTLEPLLSLAKEKTGGVGLDLHFRRNDEIHVYCGMTRILTANFLWGRGVRITAHRTYATQACARDLFRTWHVGESGFSRALTNYVHGVKIGARWTKAEGEIQMQWSRVSKPWIPIDREVVLEGQADALAFPEVRAALADLRAIAANNGWAAPTPGATELDQLGVDSWGRLVLIELKDASKSTASLYYAPFQLLQSTWVWHEAFDAVREGVQALINARIDVGLALPVPRLSGDVRAVVGFGRDARSPEVRRRYDVVLKVVNKHLPGGVPDIEVWEHSGAELRQVGQAGAGEGGGAGY